MTQVNRHRIQRQVIELAIGGGAAAPAVQESLARSFWDRAVPEIEAVFDCAASPEHLLRLDRLEIDLGAISGSDWEPQFRRRLVSELMRRLAQYRAESPTQKNEIRAEQPPADVLRQFLFFLVHGRLPWWGERPRGSWTEALTDGRQSPDWTQLRHTVLTHIRARTRLIDSLSDELLDAAIVRWCGIAHAAQVLERLAPRRSRDAARQWRRGFWRILFDSISTESSGGQRGVQLMRELLDLRDSLIVTDEGRALTGNAIHGALDPGSATRAVREMELPQPWRDWRASVAETRLPTRDADSRGVIRAPQVPAAPARPGKLPDREPVQPAPGDATYLPGAGVILLHPFLEQLFRERGLLVEREFRDPAARARGVRLLGLLAFGREDVREFDLLAAKLLCGHAFEEPLEPLELSEDDIAACDALLTAVLEHWSALRSSSPEWLRAQFFLREGKLESVDAGWRLTVERRAQDVLLTRLPWGFGVIGLPWLNERIFVHWLD